MAAQAYSPTGTNRCFDPLPSSRATRSFRSISFRSVPTASDTRHPVAYMNSSSALSRISTAWETSITQPGAGTGAQSSNRATSSTVSTSGSVLAPFGALTAADTSSATACWARAKRWNSWMEARLRALERALAPWESRCAMYSSTWLRDMLAGSVIPAFLSQAQYRSRSDVYAVTVAFDRPRSTSMWAMNCVSRHVRASV